MRSLLSRLTAGDGSIMLERIKSWGRPHQSAATRKLAGGRLRAARSAAPAARVGAR